MNQRSHNSNCFPRSEGLCSKDSTKLSTDAKESARSRSLESLCSCRHIGILGKHLEGIWRTGKEHLRSWTSKEDLLRNSPGSNLPSPKACTSRSLVHTPSLSRLVHLTLQTLQTLQTLYWTNYEKCCGSLQHLQHFNHLPTPFQRYTGCPSALFPTSSQDPKNNFAFQFGRESSEVFLVIAFFFKSLQQEWSDWLTIGMPRPSLPNYYPLDPYTAEQPLNKNIIEPARASFSLMYV